MKNFFYVILISVISSCSGQNLDLSTITIGESADKYNLEKLKATKKDEQKGHYESKINGEEVSLDLVDNGEQITNYFFDNENVQKINYLGCSIDKTLGAKIMIYNNKIAYIRVNISVNDKKNKGYYAKLLNNLGVPTDIIFNDRNEESLNLGSLQILSKDMPSYIKKTQDSLIGNKIVVYPQYMFWNKNNIIYKLGIEPVNNNVSSTLEVFTKKALKDKIILGMQNAEKDPIFNKYLK